MGFLGTSILESIREKRRQKKAQELAARASLYGTAPTPQEIQSVMAGEDDPAFTDVATNAVLEEAMASSDQATAPPVGEQLRLNARSEAIADARDANVPRVFDVRAAFAGLDPAELALAAKRRGEERAGSERLDLLLDAAPELDAAQQANAANKLDVSPYRGAGFGVFDRFGGGMDETSAVEALATKRLAKAGEVNQRVSAIDDLLNNPDASPLVLMDAMNKKQLSKPERVAIRGADGKSRYVDARRNLGGTFDYEKPNLRLEVPPGQEKGHRKVKSPITVWREAENRARSALKNEYRYERIPDKELETEQLKIYRRLMNDPSAVPPTVGTSSPAGEDAGTVPPQYETADDVRQAFAKKQITEEQAVAYLKAMGYE